MDPFQDDLFFPVVLISALLGFLCVRIAYHLFFHPLSNFPGPKLAAISHLYEFYYDVIQDGMYIWKIDQMHQKYGPIVRINPRELHIKDPNYYEVIYAGGLQKRDKDPRNTAMFMTPLPIIATVHHEQHRLRRGCLNSFFSKRSVVNMEPIIQKSMDRLIRRLEIAYKEGTVLELQRVLAAASADVISDCCFGARQGYIEQKVFRNQMIDAIGYIMSLCHVNKFIPLFPQLLRRVPPRLLQVLGANMADVIEVTQMVQRQAAASLAKKEHDLSSAGNIFDAMSGSGLPPHEKSMNRLEDEAASFFGAGTDTVPKALAVAMFYLLNNESMMIKLRQELKQVMPSLNSRADWSQLEKLPYMTAVINESLRLTYGFVGRSPRVSPFEPLYYQQYVIPPGTPISQSQYFVHMDPHIFPQPERFDPERWIEAARKGRFLNRFLVSFGKGSRMCLGIHLGYAQLYMILAVMVRCIDMEVIDTPEERIQIGRDRGFMAPKEGTFGMNIRVIGMVDE